MEEKFEGTLQLTTRKWQTSIIPDLIRVVSKIFLQAFNFSLQTNLKKNISEKDHIRNMHFTQEIFLSPCLCNLLCAFI